MGMALQDVKDMRGVMEMKANKSGRGILAIAVSCSLSGLLISQSSFADPASPPSSLMTQSSKPVVKPDWTFSAASKNWFYSARKHELEEPGGYEYMIWDELGLAAMNKSGWGLKATGSYATTQNDGAATKAALRDPSVILANPFYTNSMTDIHGQFRMYFPVSETSTAKNRIQYAYYIYADQKLAHGWNISSYATFRYFSQPSYQPTDTYFYVENEVDIIKDFNKWLSVGVGPYTQSESYITNPSGTTVDISPFVDFKIDKIFIEPRLYFPIYSVDQVNWGGGPATVGTSDIWAQLYVKLTI
jgi:hypothetical protein